MGSVALATRNAREDLAQAASWEPLDLDKDECRRLFRHLVRKDPFGIWDFDIKKAKQTLPAGLFLVQQLNVELMDALDDFSEGIVHRKFHGPGGGMRSYLSDPLEELRKRL